ncbi:unnamed protein product [Ectocarpus sp. 12 AP-2014]
MRLLYFAAASAVGAAAAFVPSAIPFSSCVRTSSSAAGSQPRQRNDAEYAAPSARRRAATAAAAAAAAASEGGGGGDGGRVGVIVCDHGSRRENANTMLFEVAERYRSFSGFEIVEAAHMELAKPSIEEAFDRCVAAGAQKVVLHPFFLSPGRHVTSDIPALMVAAAKRHPGVDWVVSEPLGLQELMPRVMHAAVSESVSGGAWRHGGE